MNVSSICALSLMVGLLPAFPGLGISCAVAQESALNQDQKQAATSLGQSPVQQTQTPAESRQQQVKQFLIGELDNLIPGEFEEGSELRKTIESAVQAYQSGDSPGTSRILEGLAKSDAAFPPIELLQAGLLFGVGNSTAGIRILEEASLKHPDYPGIYFAFARLAVSQGRITDAAALLEKAERTMNGRQLTEPESKHFRAQLYDILIDVGMRQKKYDLVRQNIDKLNSILPDNPKIKLNQAELEFIDKDYKSSFRRLQEFHKAFPRTRMPELVMARWFQQQGNQTETTNWVRKAAQNYPNDAGVQMEFANYAVNLGDFADANRAVKTIEDRTGEIDATLLLKAKMAFANQAYGIAELHYEKLAKIQPKSFDALNMYALSLIESLSEEKRKLAHSIAQQNYQQLPDNQIAQAAFGWILLKSGETEKAKTLLTRAARAPQLAPEVAYFLATFMHDSGSSQQAKLVLEPALDTKGLFLYRNAASKLMNEINKATEASLPDPGK